MNAAVLPWWMRLPLLRARCAAADRPLPATFAVFGWWVICLVAPLALVLTRVDTTPVLGFLLSIDVPFALLLATGVVLDALRADALSGAEDWLWPRAFRPARIRWRARLRWLRLVRWPAGLTFVAMLLSGGTSSGARAEAELLLMAAIALATGLALVWAMRQHRAGTQRASTTSPRRARGMAALSWAAWHETRDRFSLRHMASLAVPVLLAAPMGVMAGNVAAMLMAYLPVVFLVAVCQESRRVQVATRHWLATAPMPPRVLTFHIWRHVLLSLALVAAAYGGWITFGPHSPAPPR